MPIFSPNEHGLGWPRFLPKKNEGKRQKNKCIYSHFTKEHVTSEATPSIQRKNIFLSPYKIFFFENQLD